MSFDDQPTRVIVCGSRSWHDRQIIQDTLIEVGEEYGHNLLIIHGNAQGADRIAEQEAQKAGYLIESHPAEWGVYGKRAGLIRNSEMAALGASLCVAFWDGRSTGTAHMIEQARSRGIHVRIIEKRKN